MLINILKKSSQTVEFISWKEKLIQLTRKPHFSKLRISISPDGSINVVTKKNTSYQTIIKSLDDSENWILSTLDYWKQVQLKYPQKKYFQGEGFLFLGDLYFLDFRPSQEFSDIEFQIEFKNCPHILQCYIPISQWNSAFHIHPQQHLTSHLKKFYKIEGKRILSQRLNFYSQKMNLIPKSFTFRSQKTRWGSCSSEGRITLNWKLIAAPLNVIDYVVIHELSHLKIPNHSRTFWELVQKHLPEYKLYRKWLRQNHFALDFLSFKSELHLS